MKKVIKSTRLLALLAALLFTTLVQAQIKVGEYVNLRWTLIKTYSPPSPQVGRDQLIERFNKIYKKAVTIYLEKKNQEGKTVSYVSTAFKIRALDDRLDTRAGTIFYYSDIIVDEEIVVTNEFAGSSPSDVNVPVSRAWDKPVSDIFGSPYLKFFFRSNEDAREFAEYMYYFSQPNRDKLLALIRADSIQFSTLAAKYREMEVKPVVTEQQRKYIVQANSFAKDKLYAQAIEAYKKAIAIDPVAYPAAYYNLALLLKAKPDYYSVLPEEKDFRIDAIKNMKKYLLLVPDARAAQDKIYEWER